MGKYVFVVVFIGLGKMLFVFLWVIDSVFCECMVVFEELKKDVVCICIFYILLFKVFGVDVECNFCLFLVGIG